MQRFVLFFLTLVLFGFAGFNRVHAAPDPSDAAHDNASDQARFKKQVIEGGNRRAETGRELDERRVRRDSRKAERKAKGEARRAEHDGVDREGPKAAHQSKKAQVKDSGDTRRAELKAKRDLKRAQRNAKQDARKAKQKNQKVKRNAKQDGRKAGVSRPTLKPKSRY